MDHRGVGARHGGHSDGIRSNTLFTLPEPEASRDCNVPVCDTVCSATTALRDAACGCIPPLPTLSAFSGFGVFVPRLIKSGPEFTVCAHFPGPRGAHPGPLPATCAV